MLCVLRLLRMLHVLLKDLAAAEAARAHAFIVYGQQEASLCCLA